jgi:acetamidase/formamidase
MFTTFIFNNGEELSVSIKMRRSKDTYGLFHAFRMFFNPSEIMYIWLTERDAMTINKEILKREMHSYNIDLNNKELTQLFIGALRRTNKLADKPEFYSLFSNNCITNVLNHINRTTHIKLPQMHYSYFATQHLGKLLTRFELVKE